MSELAEGARLEIACAANRGTEGSNPSLSAKFCDAKFGEISPIRFINWRIRHINSIFPTPGFD